MNVMIAIASLVLLFALIYGAVVLWDRAFTAMDAKGEMTDARTPEGAFRFLFHFLWILLFLAVSVFLFPMILSYREEILQRIGTDRLEVLGKMMFLPGVLLLLLAYGRRRGYMRWPEDLGWLGRRKGK